MARSPFASQAPSPTQIPTPPLSAASTTAASGLRPSGVLGGNAGTSRLATTAERRTLVVGRGIGVQGTVADAERLVVEGTVEATMIHASELAIAQGGIFKGEVEVEDAEIAGTFDGVLTARGSLIVRGSGRVLGTARCLRLQVEDGGQITGRIEMLVDSAPAAFVGAPAPAPAPASAPSILSQIPVGALA